MGVVVIIIEHGFSFTSVGISDRSCLSTAVFDRR
jgi:hypothetical protein